MAKQTINIGSAANDGTGSTLRESFDITNDNFTELYSGTGGLFHKIEGTNFTGSLLIGHSTTGTLSSALNNTGIGIGALDALTSGDSNVAIGRTAGGALNSGSDNIAIGHNALATEDTGDRNTAVGRGSLQNLNYDGNGYNVAVGYEAGNDIISGQRNTVIGSLTGDALTTGSYNTALGYQALSTEDEHGYNTAIGYAALIVQNAGADAYNTAVGYYAGVSVSTGIKNVILGGKAGDTLTTGSNNIIIGYEAAASAVDVSNEITLGDSNIANVRIPSDSTLKIGASSDLQLEHLSGHSFIKNTDAGDLYIENQVDSGDVIFRSDNGSGGLATYFYLNGGDTNTNFQLDTLHPDNVKAKFGNSADLQIYHNGSNSEITHNNTGSLLFKTYVNDMQFINYATDKDIIFKSDDGSGGVTEYFRVDGGDENVIFSKDVVIQGDDKDFYLKSADHTIARIINRGSGGDLDKGLLSLFDGSTEDVRIDTEGNSWFNGGNVGIGTGSPSYKLHTKGTVNGNVNITVENASTGVDAYSSYRFKNDSISTAVVFLNGSNNTNYAGASSLNMYQGTSLPLGFVTNNLLRMIVAGDGKVGIGTDSPTTKLDVKSSGSNIDEISLIHSGNTVKIASLGQESGHGSLVLRNNSGTIQTRLNADTGNATFAGTVAAEDNIHLTDAGAIRAKLLLNASDRDNVELRAESLGSTMKFFTVGTEALELDASQNATFANDVTVTGALSKGSGSFKIDHPVKPDTHFLYHSFVESPLTDLIYRGKVKLIEGKASINIDEHFGMTDGTFVALVDDKQVFTTNEDTWDAVKGKVEGNKLNIECQNETFEGYVSWLVIGDRKDKHIMDTDWTDEKGKPILEVEK